MLSNETEKQGSEAPPLLIPDEIVSGQAIKVFDVLSIALDAITARRLGNGAEAERLDNELSRLTRGYYVDYTISST